MFGVTHALAECRGCDWRFEGQDAKKHGQQHHRKTGHMVAVEITSVRHFGQRQNREPDTGRYAFDGDMSRLCVCGHPLGIHIAGGFECGTTGDKNDPSYGCACQKFRLSRKRRA